MKQLIFILCCCLTLLACGKGSSTSNLPQSCQDVFKRWDKLIVKLESNSNIPKYYVMSEKDDHAMILSSVNKVEAGKRTGICEVMRRSVDRRLQALATDSHALDAEIQDLDSRGTFKDYK